jgi:hypothetical protein
MGKIGADELGDSLAPRVLVEGRREDEGMAPELPVEGETHGAVPVATREGSLYTIEIGLADFRGREDGARASR